MVIEPSIASGFSSVLPVVQFALYGAILHLYNQQLLFHKCALDMRW